MPPSHQSSLSRDLRSLKAAVRGGYVSNRRTVALYSQWSSFCTNLQLEHLLEDPDIPNINILQVYGHRARNGGFSPQASLLQSYLVATLWRAIADNHLLEGRQYPCNTLGPHSHSLTSVSIACYGTYPTNTSLPRKRKPPPFSSSWWLRQHPTLHARFPYEVPALSRLPCSSV